MTENKLQSKAKQFRDVIYKYVTIPPRLMRVVDTKEFQAMRRIKQTGPVSFVFPSATHSRFEHLLGSCYLGGVALEALSKSQPDLFINPLLVETVQLALLVHDIGHGCYSHSFDHVEIKLDPAMDSHEKRSVALLRWMNKTYGLDFSAEQLDITEAMILGQPIKGMPRWWFQLVSNPDFALDLDKLDYLARDSYMIGMPRDLQIERIFSHMRVVNDSLVYDEKVAELIVDIFRLRHKMHKEVYQHRVVVVIEHMITKILGEIAKIEKWEAKFADMKTHAWRQITDSALERVPDLAEQYPAEMKDAFILYNRLHNRQLPKSKSTAKKIVDTKDSKSTIVQRIIGFTSKLDENPLEKIMCFDSAGHLKSLVTCEISGISVDKPGEKIIIQFEKI